MKFSGLGITSDSQLRILAKSMGLPPIKYIGFAEDMKTLPNGLSIINIGGETVGGTHWTMLWVEPQRIIYSDSYGVGPEDNIILLANGRDIIYNIKQVQRYDEAHCGVWALLSAKAIFEKKGLDQFMDQYKSV